MENRAGEVCIMAQAAGTVLIRKNIRLGHNSHLIFDQERDFFRVAFWRPRKPLETKLVPPREVYEGMTKAAMLPKKPFNYWVRASSKSYHLSLAIRYVLEATNDMQYYDDLIHYIKSTEWGERLSV
jgi:hypothetical protein